MSRLCGGIPSRPPAFYEPSRGSAQSSAWWDRPKRCERPDPSGVAKEKRHRLQVHSHGHVCLTSSTAFSSSLGGWIPTLTCDTGAMLSCLGPTGAVGNLASATSCGAREPGRLMVWEPPKVVRESKATKPIEALAAATRRRWLIFLACLRSSYGCTGPVVPHVIGH